MGTRQRSAEPSLPPTRRCPGVTKMSRPCHLATPTGWRLAWPRPRSPPVRVAGAARGTGVCDIRENVFSDSPPYAGPDR